MVEQYQPGLYDTDWYAGLEKWQEPNTRALFAAIAYLGIPTSFLDLGCGDGFLVTLMARFLQDDAAGVELKATGPGVVAADLRHQLDLGRQFDLVISWEVGEHLPPEAADTFADNVARHVGRWLVFTAAHEGQGGDYHLNEQPAEYWSDKLVARGLTKQDELRDQIRTVWATATGPAFWLPANIQVFERSQEV